MTAIQMTPRMPRPAEDTVPMADMTLVNGDDAGPGYGAYRQDVTTDDLIAKARERQKRNAPSVSGGAASAPAAVVPAAAGPAEAPPATPAAETPAAPDQSNVHGADTWAHKVAAVAGPMFGFQLPGGAEAGMKVFKDVGVGLIETPAQIAGGAGDAVGNATAALADFTEWLDQFADIDMLGNPIEREEDPARTALRSQARTDLRDMGDSLKGIGGAPKSATGGAVRGVAQFLTGFVPAFRLLRAARVGTVAAGAGGGAIADFLTQAGDDQTIAELVQSAPDLANPITEFLASAPGDNEAVKRLKNAAEGIVPGVMLDGLAKALQLAKASRMAKAQEGAAALPSQFEAPALDQGRDFLLLGDPNGPLIEYRGSGSMTGADNTSAAQSKLAAAGKATETGVPDEVAAKGLADAADEAAEHFATGEFLDGQLRHHSDLGSYVSSEVAPKAKGERVANPSFELDGMAEGAFTTLGRQAPAFQNLPNRVFVSGRAVKHIGERRPDLMADFDTTINDLVRAPDFVLPNPNAPDPWARPWLVKQIDDATALVVEVRANGKGIDVVNVIEPVDASRLRRAEERAAALGLKLDDLKVTGPEGRTLPSSSSASEDASRGLRFSDGRPGAEDIAQDGVYINFARIETGEDVKEVLQDMADAFKGDIDDARRGVRSNEATKEAADALGMTVEDVLARRKGQGFNAEEALAARRLLTASGEKLLEAARRAAMPGASPADQFVFRKMMATHYAIQAEVIGARTETARALQAWSIPAGGGREQMKALDQILAGSGGVDVSAAMAKRLAILAETGADAATINQVIRKGAFARTMDAVKEVWINGLLSSPTTHIVNTTSNFGVALQQIGERYVAGKIAKATGSGGVADGEAGAMMFGLLMGLKDAFRTAGKALITGDAQLGFGKMEAAREPAISARAFNLDEAGGPGRVVDLLGHLARVPGRVLETQDAFFKSIGYRMELQAQAYRQASSEGLEGRALGERVAAIVGDPPENIRLAAADAALYNTFTNETGEFGKKILSLRNGGGALNPIPFIMPFVRTPINIARYSFERTPLAPLVGQWRADIAAGGARRDIALARMATGSAAMALAADMAMQGVVTGNGPSDPNERAALLRTGWQPYSVKMGDKWVSYARTDPFGMTLGAAADFTEALNRGDVDPEDVDEWNEVMAGMIAATSQFTINKTYLSGLSDFVNVMTDPERFGPGYVDQFAASFLPFTSAMGAAERAVDPTVRNAGSPMEAVLAKIPGLSDRLTPRRDLWGQPIKPDEVYGRAYDVLAPAKVTKSKESPIDQEMIRLRVFQSPIKKKTSFAGVDVDLKRWPEVYDAYVELAGNGLKHPAWNMGAKDFLDAVVSGKSEMSQVYDLMSDGADGTKGDFIRDTVRDYRELAQQQILADPKFAAFARFIAEQQGARQQRQIPGAASGSKSSNSKASGTSRGTLPALQ